MHSIFNRRDLDLGNSFYARPPVLYLCTCASEGFAAKFPGREEWDRSGEADG